MIDAALDELHHAGVDGQASVVVADAQYWNEQHMDDPDHRPRDPGADPARRRQTQRRAARLDRRPLLLHAHEFSRPNSATSSTENDKQRSSRCSVTPNTTGKFTSSTDRGRQAVRTEWRLVMMSHNLTKLYRHEAALAT